MSDKELKFQYAPGCFSEFDGTKKSLMSSLAKLSSFLAAKHQRKSNRWASQLLKIFSSGCPKKFKTSFSKLWKSSIIPSSLGNNCSSF